MAISEDESSNWSLLEEMMRPEAARWADPYAEDPYFPDPYL